MMNPTPLRPFFSRARAGATLAVAGLMLVIAVSAPYGAAFASSKDEQALRDGCTWLDRALAREPDRDDAFGMFMRGLMPKCQALLEGLARGDKSVRPEGMKAVINEIAQLQTVIDEENGGPPPATGRPTPDEVAKKKVADEKAGVDAEAQKKAEAERQAAEEAKRAEAEKKAAEDEAKRKEAEAKAAAEAERRLAEQRAKETEKERKAREAEEKKAEAARKREEERVRKEMAAAEKKAAEEAKKAEAERVKAEKRAADEAKKAEAERLKADRAAAAELEREAARQKKEREAAEAEAMRLMAEAEREAAEEARRNAREDAKVSAEEEAKLRLAREQAEQARKAAAEEEARAMAQAKVKSARGKGGPLDGTWEQPPGRSLDRNIKRTLNIFTKDGKIQGELYEEVWYPAPTAWVDRSCEGNTTFRMVTSARVTGEAGKTKLVLWRDVPRVLTCTCPSRCTVETRRRGFDLEVSPDGRELSDSSGVFVRPGTVIVGSAKQAESEATPGPVVTASPRSFVGAWETAPFKRRDETVVMRIELSLEGDKLKGMLVERSSQGLPLQSWSERFCGGATRWEWVAKWELEGDSKGKNLTLRGKGGDNLTCSCPSKCKKPKDKITLNGSLGATGSSLSIGGDLYEKK